MVPNIVRLKYKYEIHTTRHLDEERINMRAMSYTLMLGDIEEARQIIQVKRMPI